MSVEKKLKDYVDEAKAQIREVEVTEVVALLDEGYQVLDIREPAEYISGTIADALNVPRGVLEPAADRQFPGRRAELMDRDKKWLTFCATSGRSAMAAAVLKEMGFTNVININGGMAAWKSAEMLVVIPPHH